MRAAIYARYSTDRQSETSADDQARLCRERADREGWTVTAAFDDPAVSGSTRDRPGLNALLARLGEFDLVLAESLDRISRDLEDIASIWKQLRFAGVQLVTLSEGPISDIHVGLGGTVAAMQLRQLGEKTRRGQIGRVALGRIPGGISYGYRKVVAIGAGGAVETGLREIDEVQAAVVRRIFAEFLSGQTPKQIAERLNAEGVPAPAGGSWRRNTINGSRARRNGILHNELYAGRIIYNRQRFEKHPETRRRIAKPNPPTEWRVADVPELRIVDEATWTTVEAHFARMHNVPARQQKRPKRLLSGLARCGSCGGAFTIQGGETWGCAGARQGSGCANRRTISNGKFEDRVITALREKMLAPDAIRAAVTDWHLEIEADRRDQQKERAAVQRRRDRAQAKLERLTGAIANGLGAFDEVKSAMMAAAAERDQLDRTLSDLEAEPVIALNPAIAELYKRAIDNLVDSLKRYPETRAELRSLIETIIATPREDTPGLDLDLTGSLANILRIAEGRPMDGKTSVPVVAGAGFEPATFRL